MKQKFRKFLLFSSLLLSSFIAFSQADLMVTPIWIRDDANNLDITADNTFMLVEDKTFSYRESPPGTKTNTFYDMTSWDSSPFKQGYLSRTFGGNFDIMNYRLHFPATATGATYNPTYQPGYPLIVFMHGAGERGNCWGTNCYWATSTWSPSHNIPAAPTDANAAGNGPKLMNNDLVLANGGQAHDAAVNRAGNKLPNDPTMPANAWPGFVLFCQNLNTWASAEPQEVIRIVRLLLKKYNIDPNRIYVHGLSDGGAGVYEMLKRAPWLFTAGLPMSAIDDANIKETSNSSHNWVDNIAHIPLWQFQGGQDTGPTPARTVAYQTYFRDYGMSVRYTLYPSLGHGVWNNAYGEPDFFTWMLTKNKSDIFVRYGNTSICSTTAGAGVEMRLAYGFWAYQWQRDGQDVPGATSAIYNATVPGTYRARFSRVQNPTEAQWNRWSNPIVITGSSDPAPTITVVGSTHMPGINGENSIVLKGPVNKKYYYWYKNGTKMNFSPSKDTLAYITVNQSNGEGVYTLQVAADVTNCKTAFSTAVAVKTTDNADITPPTITNAVVTSSSSINLFWTDNSNNETAFEVYRARKLSPTTSSNYSLITVTGANTISFQDSGLKPDSIYNYKLRAISTTAKSVYTAAFQVTTTSDTQPPTAPQNLVLKNVSITNGSTASVTLAWDPSTDNSGIKEYVVTSFDGTTANSTTFAGNATTGTITGLTRNQGYSFTVVAHDLALNSSAPSNQLNAETIVTGLNYFMSEGAWQTLYGYPTNTTTAVKWSKIEDTGNISTVSLAPRKQDDFFYLRFEGFLNVTLPGDADDDNGNGRYIFTLNSKEGSALYIGSPSATPSSLYPNPVANPGLSTDNQIIDNDGFGRITPVSKSDTVKLGVGYYPISVIYYEYQGGGETLELYWEKTGANGFPKTLIPASAFRSGPVFSPTPPNVPTNLVATASSQSVILLTWNSTASTEIYRSSTLGGTYSIVATFTGAAGNQSFNDSGLTPGTTYYYKVRAVNSSGASAYTSVANATTNSDTTAPSVPSGLISISASLTSIGLNWTASTDDVAVTSYNIYSNSVLIGTSSSVTFTATNLSPNTSYSFTVSAKDFAGNESAQSAPKVVSTTPNITYYYDGSGPLTTTTNWGTQTDGGGTNHPQDFATDGQYFVVANVPGNATSIGSSWTIGGSSSKIIVASGTTLTIDNALSGNISAQAGATININNVNIPTFATLAPTSTVNFNTYSTFPTASYGNVNLLGTGIKDVQAGNSTIAGNLTIANGITLRGAPQNNSNFTVSGDVTISGSLTEFASDNNISLTMAGTGTNSISTGGNLALYLLDLTPGKTITFTNNTSALPLTLKLGSANGGGLTLEDGSVFQVGNNNLTFQFAAVVNQGTQTGQLDIAGGNIDFTTSATGNSTFNFGPVGKTVGLFNTNLTGNGASVTIGTPVTLTDGLKIKQGVFNANGNVTLESTASTTASIREIENGGIINGAVTVKRYAAAQGTVYRYVSFPVDNVRVADLQNYVPIYGNFTGTSSAGTASLYCYTTDWSAFPVSSNQEFFEKGRGYSFYNVNGNAPTTWQSTGVPYQGTVTISNLTGGTGASGTGWNLVGNPYASPVVWKTDGSWQTSGLGTTVYVRYNHDGGFDWQYWNTAANGGNGDGTLPNAKIPSGQAFWIQATTNTPSMVIKESAKSPDNGSQNANFFREDTTPSFGKFRLVLTGHGNSDPAFLYINSLGADSFDKMSDSEKRSNSYFNLSTYSSDSIKLAINQLSSSFSSCQKVVGLNIDNVAPGQYTLKSEVASWEGIVSLRDHYLNSVVNFAEGQSYSFDVTTNVQTFGKKRFTLEFGSPDINIDGPLLTANPSLCEGSGSAIVNLKNTQRGVNYTIVNNAGSVISPVGVGNGQALDFVISETNLTSGGNDLHVKAELTGCSSVQLPTSTTIVYSQFPVVDISASASYLCAGESAVITATGAPANGSYRWYQQDQNGSSTLRYAGNKLEIESLTSSTNFLVQAVNANGCTSEAKNVTVIVTTLTAPEISQSGDTFYSSSNYNNQWLKDGQPIDGMTGISFKPSAPGVYTVRTTANGCSKDSDPVDYLVSGLEQPSASDGYLVVYPNPTNQHNLQLRGNISGSLDDAVNVQLIDINGKIHLSTQFTIDAVNNGVKLDTASDTMAPGLYLVVIKVGPNTTKRKVMIN